MVKSQRCLPPKKSTAERTAVLAALPDALAPRKVLSQGLGTSQAESFFLGQLDFLCGKIEIKWDLCVKTL